MITPGQKISTISEESVLDSNANEREQIEAYFDECIQRTTQLTHGQLVVELPVTRSSWLLRDIDAVLDKYRDAGWTVADRGRGRVYARLIGARRIEDPQHTVR